MSSAIVTSFLYELAQRNRARRTPRAMCGRAELDAPTFCPRKGARSVEPARNALSLAEHRHRERVCFHQRADQLGDPRAPELTVECSCQTKSRLQALDRVAVDQVALERSREQRKRRGM